MSLAIDWFRTKRGEDPMAYLDDVFRYTMLRVGRREDAEDIAIEVVQALPNPCSKSNLRMYMIGMARRKIADLLRGNRETADIRDHDATTSFEDRSDEVALVGAALDGLSADHREVLILKYIVGFTVAEIAKIVGKKPEAIDSMLQRARASFEQSWLRLTSNEVIP